MKRFFVIGFTLLTIHSFLLAQKEIISVSTDFIVAKKYDSANRYLDSVLKRDPKNVDALMMKGNVTLNRAAENLPAISAITKNDESIFSPVIGPKEAKILPIDTVRAIEKWWRKSLEIDSTRNDIRKGLCTLYSMALMKDELKNEIATLIKSEKSDDGEQAYRIAEYARKIKERGRFDDAMDIYQFLASLFPDVAGLRCDIANEYFYEGRMNETLAWLDSCFNFKIVDETSFLNGAFTYSELGYFDDAQNVLNSYSHIYQRKMDQFYEGLRLFADSSPRYSEVLSEFMQTVDTNSYSTEVHLAQKLLSCCDSFSLDDFRKLAADQNIPDYYRVLIMVRGMKQFLNDCESFIIYGIYQSSIKNYSAAVQLLEEGEHCEIGAGQNEYWKLVYAYMLFHTDQKKSLLYFSQLYRSSNSFHQQAAKYFSASILISEKQDAKAKRLLTEIVAATGKTKYGELAELLIQNLK